MASPKFSNRTAKLYRTPTAVLCHLQSWLYQINDRIYQGWTCCCTLLSPQTPRDCSRLQRLESQHQSDLWSWSEGAQGCTQWKKIGCSFLDHHQFGKIYLVLPSEEELLMMLSPLLLKLDKLQSDSGKCCWGCPSAAGGTGSGKGMKNPGYHLPQLACDWT